MKKRIIVTLLLAGWALTAAAQPLAHPRLIAKEGDKAALLEKIRTQPWAKDSYQYMVDNLSPYVERHKSDPQWILSRYQMNWGPGRHYTDYYAERWLIIDSMDGNAPYPTVRVALYGRRPVNDRGNAYLAPKIEDVVPYDTASRMLLVNPDTGEKEAMEPWAHVEGINRTINDLALDAAIVYWLTGDEAYAKFGADILNQFARGA